MMASGEILKLAEQVLGEARQRSLKLVTAESCTGGLVAAALTEIPGSSDVFERGFITYSNQAKMQILGVDADILRDFGAVSDQTVRAMAEGALTRAIAHTSIAITGIAGPNGGSPGKPVGLVHFATARKDHATISQAQHFGDIGRRQVREASVEVALRMLLHAISS